MSTTTYSAHRNRPYGIDANDVDDRVTQLDRALTAQLADARAQIARLDWRIGLVERDRDEALRQLDIALKALQRLGQLPEGWS